jgi:hypothetical protein
MEAARISRIISPNGEDKPERESQVRPLASLAPEAMRKVWARGGQQAKGGRLSAKMVERAVANLFPQNVKTVGSARLARKLGKRLAELAAACRGEGWAEAEMAHLLRTESILRQP